MEKTSKLCNLKNKLVIGAGTLTGVLVPAVITHAADTTVSTIDAGATAAAVKTAFESTAGAVLPVAGGIFATILGIKMIPRMIKWFTRG